MAHAFDGRDFQQLLDDTEHLLSLAADHEQRLTRMVDAFEDSRSGAAAAEMLPSLREVCIAARAQRQLIQTLAGRLLGDLAHRTSFGRRPRILVIDDSQDNRDLIAAALETAGYHAITASNGLEGVIVAHYARPAVILMDLRMPVLDGIEAARLLKASAVTRELKVIAHTANPDLCDGPLTMLFADTLTKPARPEAIVATVQRFLTAGPSGSSVAKF